MTEKRKEKRKEKKAAAMGSRPLVELWGPLLRKQLPVGLPWALPLSAPSEDGLSTLYTPALPLDRELPS